MQAGIYMIKNISNGKKYIGSSSNLHKRWRSHQNALNRNCHVNKHLQNSWNKHGIDSFSFSPLLVCSMDSLLLYEQKVIDEFRPEYNVAVYAASPMKGRNHTEDARFRMSMSHQGKKRSDEAKANMSLAQAGRKLSLEHRKKISIARTGTKHTPEAIEKLRISSTGREKSLETRAKLSASLIGKKRRPLTEEHRKKISSSLIGNTRCIGYKHSRETKKKLSMYKNMLGKKHTEESKAKMSATIKARWEFRKKSGGSIG